MARVPLSRQRDPVVVNHDFTRLPACGWMSASAWLTIVLADQPLIVRVEVDEHRVVNHALASNGSQPLRTPLLT